ncbi:uncharacterized protein NECHADRAFT_51108 [Fusarium vanettenii 77-13-4]|uniref:Uncharacterized protein n=1 Tax=Fusarium vanettenii (strain ATCC MYA-4622 / CBS 123669 / FGSC 9596 / NRRL 45880 / 77-13-4) TaxID=660122 RepID=C7Z1I2_FUSV7|nr:uncharacterized protein NECHADRAFT_51108 [Fusarium vanettenii 77-13-4]EEU42009.1 hypothetical protein NECHADRAFT_51108 [Fusarium vanettenii 77-13-4]
MPCFRGVDISIVAQPGSKKLPEFPHSDASSVRSPHIQKASPRVSVYVPSVPGRSLLELFLGRDPLTPVLGAQFGIHYSLSKIPEPPCYLYFKIFMNGRNATNCGVNPAAQASGSITRSLCEPSDRWHYKENGVLHKREGIEARCFYFLPTSSRTSVADDGGLIEIQVFRAKGRKRRSPILGKHRDQDTYGIATPSGGLVESPETTCYYDWILIDPKEFPFVSFHFHYRSWSNLCQLNLAPAFTELGEFPLLIQENPRGVTSGLSTGDHETKGQESIRFEDTCDKHAGTDSDDDLLDVLSRLALPPKPPGRPLSGEEIPKMAPPGGSVRPLPEIPTKKPTLKKSFESCTPSITPSLLPYIEEEPSEVEEEVEIGLAKSIPVRSESLRGNKPRPLKLAGLGSRPEPLSLPKERMQPTLRKPSGFPIKTPGLDHDHTQRESTNGRSNQGCQAQSELGSEIVSIVTETEQSFKTEWTLSEGEWMKRGR